MDFSFIRLQQSKEQLQSDTLSRAAPAHDAARIAMGYIEGHPVQNQLVTK